MPASPLELLVDELDELLEEEVPASPLELLLDELLVDEPLEVSLPEVPELELLDVLPEEPELLAMPMPGSPAGNEMPQPKASPRLKKDAKST
jgi:hypothetical protein